MTRIIAHRGSSGNRPENTLPAFAEAVRIGAGGIELDVHLSKDQQVIVMHDEEINRTTNGKGLIREKTLSELKSYNAGTWFNKDYQATKIPTLKEALNLLAVRNYRGIVTIEVKTDKYHYPEIEQRVSEILTSQQWPFEHWYGSFNIKTLDLLHELEPQTQLDLIMKGSDEELAAALERPYIKGIHPHFQWAFDHAKELTDNRLAVRPWTVDEDEAIRRCFTLNFAGMITNVPEHAQRIKNNRFK